MFNYRLIIWIFFVALASDAYRFTELNRFYQPGHRECWDAMLVDVRANITPLGSCFYPKNGTLSERLVPELLHIGPDKVPDVLFNPMHYAMYLGFIHEKYYSMSTFTLHDYPGMPTVETRTLDKTMALQVMNGNDEMMKQKYTHFCAIKTHFRPVLQCLASEIPGLLPLYEYYCTEEQSNEVQMGIQLSMINWEFYDEFCEEIFRCSSHPIDDCRAEIKGEEVSMMKPMTTFESLCMIMPNFDSMFVPCLRHKIKDCSNRVKRGYNKFIYDIQQASRKFMIYPNSVRSLCRIIETTCDEPEDWVKMNQVTNRCFKKLYEMNLMHGGQALSMINTGQYQDMDDAKVMEICDEVTDAQRCIRNETWLLRCRENYVLLVKELLHGLNASCTQLATPKTIPTFPQQSTSRNIDGTFGIFQSTLLPPWLRTFAPTVATPGIPSTPSRPPVITQRTNPPTVARTTRRTQAPITVRQPAVTVRQTTREIEQQLDNTDGAGRIAPFLNFIFLPILMLLMN